MILRYHLQIKGKVHGVFFRASTLEKAQELGLKGWIKNCLDGSVETQFEGPKKEAKALLDWCHQGPSKAQVTHLIQLPLSSDPLPDFYIQP